MLSFEERPSDSPFVDRVWRSDSSGAGSFTSIAAVHGELVVTRDAGRTTLTLRGPETRATRHAYPPGMEWFGVDFTLGTFMPHFPPAYLVNLHDATFPCATGHSFRLLGSEWPLPSFENIDTFVDRLAREGLLAHDPVVATLAHGGTHALSPRSVQNRFVRATGLSPKMVEQIQRARHAVVLLKQGASIVDTTHEAGYFDQPHLTRSLKRFVGETPVRSIDTPFIGLRPGE